MSIFGIWIGLRSAIEKGDPRCPSSKIVVDGDDAPDAAGQKLFVGLHIGRLDLSVLDPKVRK
jgi:hypothetical protein